MTDGEDDTPTLEGGHDKLLELQKDLFRQFNTKYERRLGTECLAAWRAGYEYLLAVKGPQIPTHRTDDGYRLELKVAFVPYHDAPGVRDLPDGYEYELIPLDVLDDERARNDLRTKINSDHDQRD